MSRDWQDQRHYPITWRYLDAASMTAALGRKAYFWDNMLLIFSWSKLVLASKDSFKWFLVSRSPCRWQEVFCLEKFFSGGTTRKRSSGFCCNFYSGTPWWRPEQPNLFVQNPKHEKIGAKPRASQVSSQVDAAPNLCLSVWGRGRLHATQERIKFLKEE